MGFWVQGFVTEPDGITLIPGAVVYIVNGTSGEGISTIATDGSYSVDLNMLSSGMGNGVGIVGGASKYGDFGTNSTIVNDNTWLNFTLPM